MSNWLSILDAPIEIKTNDIEISDNYTNIDEIKDIKADEDTLKRNCEQCNIEMQLNNSCYVCKKCGLEIEYKDYSSNYGNNMDCNNISENSFISLKIVGKASHQHNKNLIQNCSDYAKYSYNNNVKDLRKIIYQLDGKQIPDDTITGSNDLFTSIKKAGNVFRGNSRKGILANCLSIMCDHYNIPKTPEYLCSILDISEKYYSQGNKIVHDLVEKKIITLPTINDKLSNFITQYMMLLQIDMKYKQFIIDVINRAEDKYLHLLYNCKDSTKCCGSILLLITRVKSLNNITCTIISTKCKVSKTTFKKYYKLIYKNYKYFKPVFRKHRIPMPIEWKK